ncbi:MAG: S41 family peptidase [Acidobacteria bacterium]|nr:S41 family peptidase [Acidobacteriota bacterium]
MNHRFTVCVLAVVLASSLAGGFLIGKVTAKPEARENPSPEIFLTGFTEALDVIQRNYVRGVSPDRLIYSAIKGMLRSLDPHSNFLDPGEFAGLKEDQHSRYFGVGIRVRPLFRYRGRVVIVEPPVPGTPAEKRGLRAGDVIARIEGQPIDDWTSDEVVENLRGPRGTKVHISVERSGIPEVLEFTVERDEIPIDTVTYAFEVKPGIGYIKIDRFSESTAGEFLEKIEEMGVEKLSGLILDLRDNPGGLLNQAIDISDFFLPRHETIVSTKGRARGSDRIYRAAGVERVKIPLVVLINRHSASASEIVAGALQDHDRALIVGETSFGKGLVQQVYTLGNNTGMTLTTAKYYTPSDRLIQRDYSVSSFEYYYTDESRAGLSGSDAGREIRQTDSGRTVLGGGGIAPDIAVPVRELGRFEAILESKDVFFQYARRLTSGQVAAARDFTRQLEKRAAAGSGESAAERLPDPAITEEMLADFKEYVRSRDIGFSEEDFIHSKDFIGRRIKQEVFTSSFGLQEGHKIRIQGDTQVLKALEVLPEAKFLMTSGRTRPAMQNRSN